MNIEHHDRPGPSHGPSHGHGHGVLRLLLAAGILAMLQTQPLGAVRAEEAPQQAADGAEIRPDLVHATFDSAGRRLVLTWPRPTDLQVDQGAGEIFIRSERPIDPSALEDEATRLPVQVQALSWSYDGILLELAPDSGARLTIGADSVTLVFSSEKPEAAVAPAAVESPGPIDGGFRRQLLLVRADFLDGLRAQALQRAERAIPLIVGNDERQALAAQFRELGRPDRGLALLQDRANLPAMPEGYLTQLAATFHAAGRSADGLLLFERLRPAANGRADPGWAILATAAGQGDAVARWLADAGRPASEALRELNSAATAAGLSQLALQTARMLQADDETTDTLLRLATALRMNGQAGEARTILNRLPPDDPAVRAERLAVLSALGDTEALRLLYREALQSPGASQAEREQAAFDLLSVGGAADALDFLEGRAAETGPATDGEPWLFAYADAADKAGREDRLADFLISQLDRSDLSQTQSETRLALLVERAPRQARRFLAERAASRGGSWAVAYQDLLRRDGDRATLARFLLQRGLAGGLPDAQRRETAFALLDLGDKSAAIRIFQALSANGPADGPDVLQLAYLWGPRPGPVALDWIEERALAAPPQQRRGWLDLLGRLGGGVRILALVDAGRVDAATAGNAYLDALLRTGRTGALATALDTAIARETEPEQLRDLAGIAERGRLDAQAMAAWQRLLSIRPDDRTAMRQIASQAATLGRYGEARTLLQRYLRGARATAEDLYALAETERALRLPEEAAGHYREAAALIDTGAPPSFDARVTRGLIAHRLGNTEETLDRFESLYSERPNDRALRDIYAEILLDLGQTARAREMLQ